DLVRGLALQPQRDQEPADLRGSRLARHDRVHHRARLRAVERASVEEKCERFLDHRLRKLRQSSGPSGVRTLSGWNCTPSTGSERCRTAITSPSSVVAETSSSSGTRVAAREWYRPAWNSGGRPAKIPRPSCETALALPCTSRRAW